MMKTAFDTWLANGNITIFCGSHTDSFKKDVLTSSLLSDLTAAHKSSNPVISWPTYRDTVQKIGWTTNSQSSKRLEFTGISLLDIVQESLRNTLSQDEQQSLTKAIGQLTELQPESAALTTIIMKLESNAVASKATTAPIVSTAFLLTIVRNNKNLITQQVAFAAPRGLAVDLLAQPVLSAIDDRQTNSWQLRSLLDERHFSQLRVELLRKLGHSIETKLLHIPAPIA